MKLASLRSKDKSYRNGDLIIVAKNHEKAVRSQCPTLIAALENWPKVYPALKEEWEALNLGKSKNAFTLNIEDCLAPITNGPGFYDGSAFLSHVVRARRARGDQMPESAKITPLMYQGVSDNLLSWNAPLQLMDPAFGGDFEGEFGVLVTDVPRGCSAEQMTSHMVLFTMFNDITYREIVKTEIETKFGFLQSKPNSSFAPFVVTADELGSAWDGQRVSLDLEVTWNGKPFGKPNGREMHFSFQQLVAHAARTRPLSAGSIIGTGTISNEDKAKGFACLTEKRFQEILDGGKPVTPWLQAGDRVTMDVKIDGKSVFGCIDQKVTV